MKKLSAILILLSLCLGLKAATVTFTLTNSVGIPDTNAIKIFPVASYINADGSIQTTGLPFWVVPNTNGFASTNLLAGNYLATNSFICSQYFGPGNFGNSQGILFSVPSTSGTYPVGQLAISGYNVFNYSGAYLTNGTTVIGISNALGYIPTSFLEVTGVVQSLANTNQYFAGTNITFSTNGNQITANVPTQSFLTNNLASVTLTTNYVNTATGAVLSAIAPAIQAATNTVAQTNWVIAQGYSTLTQLNLASNYLSTNTLAQLQATNTALTNLVFAVSNANFTFSQGISNSLTANKQPASATLTNLAASGAVTNQLNSSATVTIVTNQGAISFTAAIQSTNGLIGTNSVSTFVPGGVIAGTLSNTVFSTIGTNAIASIGTNSAALALFTNIATAVGSGISLQTGTNIANYIYSNNPAGYLQNSGATGTNETFVGVGGSSVPISLKSSYGGGAAGGTWNFQVGTVNNFPGGFPIPAITVSSPTNFYSAFGESLTGDFLANYIWAVGSLHLGIGSYMTNAGGNITIFVTNGVAINTNSAGSNALEVNGTIDAMGGFTSNGKPLSTGLATNVVSGILITNSTETNGIYLSGYYQGNGFGLTNINNTANSNFTLSVGLSLTNLLNTNSINGSNNVAALTSAGNFTNATFYSPVSLYPFTSWLQNTNIIGIPNAGVVAAKGQYDLIFPGVWTNRLGNGSAVVYLYPTFYIYTNGTALYSASTPAGPWSNVTGATAVPTQTGYGYYHDETGELETNVNAYGFFTGNYYGNAGSLTNVPGSAANTNYTLQVTANMVTNGNAAMMSGTAANGANITLSGGGYGTGISGIGGAGGTVTIAQGGTGSADGGAGGTVNLALGGTGFTANGNNGTVNVGNLNIEGTVSGAGVVTNSTSVAAGAGITVTTNGSTYTVATSGIAVTNRNWNLATIYGNGSVNFNGINTNYPASTTAGIQEVWNLFQSTVLQTNFGPTAASLEISLPAQYVYYSTPILFSNYYTFGLTIHGADLLSSKLVYTGPPTNVPTFSIIGGVNTNTEYSFPATVFLRNISFSATNNTTNILVDIENSSWTELHSVGFFCWQMMTNQLQGAAPSFPNGLNSPPGLVGLRIRTVGDHLTYLDTTTYAGLAIGADIKCDHLVMDVVKPSLCGGTTATGNISTLWPSNSIYGFPAVIQRRGGINTTIKGDVHNYSSCTFMDMIGVENANTTIYNYEQEGGQVDFTTDTAYEPRVFTLVGTTASALNCFFMQTNSAGVRQGVNTITIPVSGYDENNNFLVQTPNGTTTFGADGTIYGNGLNLTNLNVPYLTGYSNGISGSVMATFTTTNTITITTNGANSYFVTNAPNTAFDGNYVKEYLNLTLNCGMGAFLGVGLYTNTLGNNISLVLNDTNAIANSATGVTAPPAWFLQYGTGGTNVVYDNGGSLSAVDVPWEDESFGPGPNVYYGSVTKTTNYINRTYFTGVQAVGVTTSVNVWTNTTDTHGWKLNFTQGLLTSTNTF